MGKLMKIIWAIISVVPILFVFTVLCFIDFLTSQLLFKSYWWSVLIFVACILLFIILIIVIKWAKKHLERHELKIIEAEPKDSELAVGLISYLLPLVTLSLNDINIYVFAAMMFVLILLLIFTRIISFNPLMYFLGYRYYKVKLNSGMVYTVLSRRKKYNYNSSKGYVEIFQEIYLEVE